MESFLFLEGQFPSPFYLSHDGLRSAFYRMHSRNNQHPKMLTYFRRNQTFIGFHISILCYGLQIASGIILLGRSPTLNVLPQGYAIMNVMIVLQHPEGRPIAHRHVFELHKPAVCLFRSLPFPLKRPGADNIQPDYYYAALWPLSCFLYNSSFSKFLNQYFY